MELADPIVIDSIGFPKHILSASQFNKNHLHHLFEVADIVKSCQENSLLKSRLMSLLQTKRAMLYFTQPSTRTFLSFQSACYSLGLKTCEIRDPNTSSEIKGETPLDALRTFSHYVDVIIMRSPIPKLCHKTAELLDNTPHPVSIINAGSGADEHPTQAFLDLYTLHSYFKENSLEGKNICFIGDLKRGRTVRSLTKLLTLYKVNLTFCAPEDYEIKGDLRKWLICEKIKFYETDDFEEAIKKADAIYMTRLQSEHDLSDLKNSFSDRYHLKYHHLELLQENTIILHPLPRRDELDPLIDNHPKAMYWEQERNGVWIRAALLLSLFNITIETIRQSLL